MQDAKARVTVIIPARNAEATLARTLDSLLAQTFSGWDAVVVDDGSKDGTSEISARYAESDGRFRRVSGLFGSASAARNAGIGQGGAEWLLFLDADDTLDPTMLDEMFAAADARPNIGAVHCGWRCVNQDELIAEDRCAAEGDLFALLARKSAFVIHACLVRRSAVEDAGLFDPSLKTCEDTDLWARVARCGVDFVAVPRTLVTYNIRTRTTWFDPEQLIRDMLRVVFTNHGPDPRVHCASARHALGAPRADLVVTAYHCGIYAGGLAVGSGKDPQSVLDHVAEVLATEGVGPIADLDPEWCANSIIAGIPVSLGRSPSAWPELWDQMSPTLVGLFDCLERQSRSPGLRHGVMRALERRIAGYLLNGGRVGGTIRVTLAADAPLTGVGGPDVHTARIAVTYDGAIIGELSLPVCDDVVPAAVLADAIAGRFAWPILGRYFAAAVYPGLTILPAGQGQSVMRGKVHIADLPPGISSNDTAFHDEAGWAIFLQEVWGRPEWPKDAFYEPVRALKHPTVTAPEVVLEVGGDCPGFTGLAAAANVRVQIAGLVSGWLWLETDGGELGADRLAASATQALGYDLCRLVVREALLGEPLDGRRLTERLAAVRDARRPFDHVQPSGTEREPGRVKPQERTKLEWGVAAAAAGLADGTLLIGRWPSQSDCDLSLARGTLPAAVADILLAVDLDRPPILATNTHTLSRPSRILYAPEVAGPPSFAAVTRGGGSGPVDARGIVRHHFETLFASRANPWGYTSNYEQTKYEQTLSQLPLTPRSRVLELACAEGHFTVQLASKVRSLVAVDISETALERARERCALLDNVTFRRLDLARDRIEGVFDVIVCSEVLYYLSDVAELQNVASSLAAALAPGGRLVLAHANVVVDAPGETGFDWAVPFGARTIGETFARTSRLIFEQELRTTLYRIQRFKRRGAVDLFTLTSTSPQRVVTADFSLPEPDVARRILWDGGVVVPTPAVHPATRRLPILMYHRVSPDRASILGRYCVEPTMFEAQLRYLRDVGFRSASFETWRRARRSRQPLPGNCVLITFDDGYYDFAEHAWPILKRYGFEATVFIPTDDVGNIARWDEKYGSAAALLGWEDIRGLRAEGVRFGSHSASHTALTNLDNEGVVRELLRSRIVMEQQLKAPVSTLCYPYGLFTPEIAHFAQACGYTDAVSSHGGCSPLDDDGFALRRVEVDGRESLNAFIASLTS